MSEANCWKHMKLSPQAAEPGVLKRYHGCYEARSKYPFLVVNNGKSRTNTDVIDVDWWHVTLPDGFELPWAHEFGGRPSRLPEHPRYFEMEVEGVVSEEGHFGERGLCCRQLSIVRVINAKECVGG